MLILKDYAKIQIRDPANCEDLHFFWYILVMLFSPRHLLEPLPC